MSDFTPFANESDCLQISDLTIENRLDRISIFGSIDLTRDKAGCADARELKTILDALITVLESEDLPDRITVTPPDTVKNPFA